MKGIAIINRVKEKIFSKIFQKIHSIGKGSFSRERKLTFPIMFSMILKLVKKSLAIECELMQPSSSDIPPSKQAFSKARYKIRHTGFQELLGLTIETAYEEPDFGTWKGYRLIAADGSSIRLPESKEVVAAFGKFKPNGTQGNMPPLGRISLFVDLCTSMICSARLTPWNIGEQTSAEIQLPEIVHSMRDLKQEKLLFIYDRGYTSLKFIKQHNSLEVDFIFRLQGRCYLKLWERVKSGEKDFDFLLQNKQDGSESMVRVVAISLANGKTEVLLTSLFNRKKFTLKDISNAYILRWHIEECYKRLKVCAELENFSGVNLEAVLQEFWAHLLMCNILSLNMCDTQGPWDPCRISEYRLNFSVLFGVMREKLRQTISGNCDPDDFRMLFERASLRAKVKIRPGRLYSREKADKPKRHHVFRRVC
jgi:hypothetical protein